jgi:hypothetical protein
MQRTAHRGDSIRRVPVLRWQDARAATNEDITSLDAHIAHTTTIQGPMNRALMRELYLEVSSLIISN